MEFYSQLLSWLAVQLIGKLNLDALTLTELQCLTDLKEQLYGQEAAQDLIDATVTRWNSLFPDGARSAPEAWKDYIAEHNPTWVLLSGSPLEGYRRACYL